MPSLIYADSLAVEGLAKVHALKLSSSLEAEFYTYTRPKYKFDGYVKGAWEPTYVKADSNPATKNGVAFYALSPEYKKFRLWMGYYPDLIHGGGSSWDDSTIRRYSDEYETTFDVFSTQVSYSILDNLYLSLGIKKIFGKSNFLASYPPFYTISLEGEGSGLSYIGSLAYKPSDALMLSISGNTRAYVKFKGDIDASSSFPVKYELKNGGDIEGVQSPWYLIEVTWAADRSLVFWAGYKKTFASDPGRVNLPGLEAFQGAFANLTGTSYDVDSYRIGGMKMIGAHTVSGTAFYVRQNVNKDALGFSAPKSDTQVLNLSYRYALTKSLGIGVKCYIARYSEQNIDNAKMDGSFSETYANSIMFSIKKRF